MAKRPQQTLKTLALQDGRVVSRCNTILTFHHGRDDKLIAAINRRLAGGEYLASIIVSMMREGWMEIGAADFDEAVEDDDEMFDLAMLGGGEF